MFEKETYDNNSIIKEDEGNSKLSLKNNSNSKDMNISEITLFESKLSIKPPQPIKSEN